MASQDQKGISLNEQKDENAVRGVTDIAQANLNQNALGMGTNPMAAKNASQSATQQFGGVSEEVMTLEPEVQSKVQIQVVDKADVEPQHNDICTVACPDMSCKEAMTQMQGVLGAYKGEMDFSTDEEKMELYDGLVFVDGFYAVHFKIYTFTDEATKTTRWELRRLSGNAMAAAKFFAQVKNAFFKKDAEDESSQSKDNEATALEALPLNADDMKLELSQEQEERMMIHEALLSDEVGTEMDEKAESYLTSKLAEVNAISKEAAVDHKLLVKALMDESVLLHKDVAVQRAALMILSKFAGEQGKEMVAAGLPKMLEEVSKDAKYGSISKRVEALSKMLTAE